MWSGVQDISLKDRIGISSLLEEYNEREYLVVDMSLEWCKDCVDFANAHNNDQDFIARVSGSSSCRFVTLVESGTLLPWLGKI